MTMNKPVDNEDKLSWCQWGDEQEKNFLEYSKNIGLLISRNPEKEKNKYVHDMFITLPSDLKTIETPFYTADRYNIDPKYAITINKKDLESYSKKHPMMILILNIKYPHYNAIHLAPLKYLILAVKNGKAKEHRYLKRFNDQNGNAKTSYVYDCRWFPKWSDTDD